MKKRAKNKSEITRKTVIKIIGGYGKYAAFTALGTYLVYEINYKLTF
jgi:hypothetical protein